MTADPVVVAVVAGITVATTATVVATVTGHRSRPLLKAIASAGFMALGLLQGPDSVSELLVLAGLGAGAVGDVALTGRSPRSFLVGMGAFALGHLAYGVAWAPAATGSPLLWGVGAATATAIGTARWLHPHLRRGLRRPVLGYVVIIAGMLATAIGTWTPLVTIGGTLFAASDVFVARQRFVAPQAVNSILGLPAYYLAQVMIALSIG